MADKTTGAGEANDAGASSTDGDAEVFEEGTREDHDAAIRAKLIEAADAAVASAETAVEKTKAHAAGAEEALKEAEAQRASLEE